jgi:hypothetical protein
MVSHHGSEMEVSVWRGDQVRRRGAGHNFGTAFVDAPYLGYDMLATRGDVEVGGGGG